MKAANSETVLITGASSGIGLELAKCFAADGCRLVLLARDIGALESLAGELRRTNQIEALVMTADLSRPETPGHVFKELEGRGIVVDVLVNNAGFGAQGIFAGLPLQRQLEMVQVNVAALTNLTGLFLPGMIERRRGGVINVGSVAGFLAGPGMAVYYATKAFVLSFTEALAEELAGSGLTVTALCPGPTETNFGKVARGGKVRRLKITKMTAQAVAHHGYEAFRHGKIVAIPGLRNRVLIFWIRITPRWLVRRMSKFYNHVEE